MKKMGKAIILRAVLFVALCVVMATGGFACMDYKPVEERMTENFGVLQLPLVAEGTSGALYRLRNARFQIQGPTYLYLYSENYLNDEVISAELEEGDYLVELYNSWYLEKKVGNVYRKVDAVLMSKNPVGFTIYDQFKTRVAFQFKVGSDVITPGNGEIEIVIEVDDRDAGTSDAAPGDAAPDAN